MVEAARGREPRHRFTAVFVGAVACSIALPSILLATDSAIAQTSSAAETQRTNDSPPPPSRGGASADEDWAEQESRALKLVRTHLPDLRQLLDYLRRESPPQYRRAIRDLARQSRRLESSRQRDERLYEIDLGLLKSRTEIDLLAAKLKIGDDRKLHRQLKEALRTHQQRRLERLVFERSMLKERLAKTEAQLETINQRLDRGQAIEAAVEEAYRAILQRAERDKSRGAQPKKADGNR